MSYRCAQLSRRSWWRFTVGLAACGWMALCAASAWAAEGAPFPSLTYLTNITTVGNLKVEVRTLATYDYPMTTPHVWLNIANNGASELSNFQVLATLKELVNATTQTQLAAQPPWLYLKPGESQLVMVDMNEAQGIPQLPFGPTTRTVQFQLGNQGTFEVPLSVRNFLGFYCCPTPAAIPAADAMAVSGRVVDGSGQALEASISIGLGSNNMNGRVPAQTGSSFSFTVPKGSWAVVATRAGYQTGYAFVDGPLDQKNLTITMAPVAGPTFAYAEAVVKERQNAFWQGIVSADQRTALFSPGVENWDPGISPFKSQQKAMLYRTNGDKLWEFSVGTDAWGADLSADGRKAAWVLQPGQGPGSTSPSIVVVDAATGRQLWSKDLGYLPTVTTQEVNTSNELRFSNDASFIAIATARGQLSVIDASDGRLIWSLFLKGPIRSIRMSKDNRTFYATSAGRITGRFGLADGSVTWVAPTGSWAHQTGLKESPDGTLVGTISQEGIVTMLDARSGSVIWSAYLPSKGHWVGFSADSNVFVASTLAGTWGFDARTGGRRFVVAGSSGGGFVDGASYFVLPSDKTSVGIYDTTGTRVSNVISGLDWSDPNYYFGWGTSDLSTLIFAKNFFQGAGSPVLFFVSRLP